MSKLKYYDVRRTPLDLFKNYLNNFKTLNIKSGVTQRCLLEPLLFLSYINGMHLITEHADMHHFFFCTNVLYEHKSIKKINRIINLEKKGLRIGLGKKFCFMQ